jgi:hypothetical protein
MSTKTSTLTRTQVYLDKQSLTKAKKVAKTSNMTISSILRQALDEYLNNQNIKKTKPKLTIIELKDTTTKNYSERVNEIYE